MDTYFNGKDQTVYFIIVYQIPTNIFPLYDPSKGQTIFNNFFRTKDQDVIQIKLVISNYYNINTSIC